MFIYLLRGRCCYYCRSHLLSIPSPSIDFRHSVGLLLSSEIPCQEFVQGGNIGTGRCCNYICVWSKAREFSVSAEIWLRVERRRVVGPSLDGRNLDSSGCQGLQGKKQHSEHTWHIMLYSSSKIRSIILFQYNGLPKFLLTQLSSHTFPGWQRHP